MPGAMPAMSPGMMTPNAAATPSANLGAQAAAAAKIKQALLVLEQELPHLELGSPLHAAVRTSINALAKHIPVTGGEDQAQQASVLRDLALKRQQQSPLLAALMARQGAGAGTSPGAGAPTTPPAGAPAPSGE